MRHQYDLKTVLLNVTFFCAKIKPVFMKRNFFNALTALILIVVAAVGCQNDNALIVSNDRCATCPSGGGSGEGGGGGKGNPVKAPDLVVYSVFNYGGLIGDKRFAYGVVIKNIGNAPVSIHCVDDVYCQAWLSTDGVTRNVSACRTISLNVNNIFDVNGFDWPAVDCHFYSSVDFNTYRYMILDLHVDASLGEIKTSNNTAVVRTPLPECCNPPSNTL